jgi:DnaJ-class molecular chaperone
MVKVQVSGDNPKERTMRVILMILAFFAASTCLVMAEEQQIPPDKAVIQFDTKLGVVTFLHQKHADLSSTECTTCHHTFKGEAGETVKPCHACHDKDSADAPAAKTAFHTRCTGCHEYTVSQGDTAGPLKKKCKLCHIK